MTNANETTFEIGQTVIWPGGKIWYSGLVYGECKAVVTGSRPSADRLGVVYYLDVWCGEAVILKTHAPARTLRAA